MRLSTIFAALSLALAPANAFAQTAPAADEPVFTPQQVRAHVSFLASDELEGRNAGTRGHEVAARYVASRFEALGLTPAGENGGWYQNVPLVEIGFDPKNPATLTVGSTRFPNGENILMQAGSNVDKPNEIISGGTVFVGYGIEAPNLDLDDYAGLDVKGKVVAMLLGLPAAAAPEARKLAASKAETARKHGAVGIIYLLTPADLERVKWDEIGGYFMRPQTSWVGADGKVGGQEDEDGGLLVVYAKPAVTKALLAGTKPGADAVFAAAAKGDPIKAMALKPNTTIARRTSVKRVASPNVVAILPGSDPSVANEYVLITAHLDHEGVDSTLEGDQIYNGAMDNAVGIATMLEVARGFSESGKRPRRPILFAAVTAEEDGLIGSDYLARHPVVGEGRVIADVNLDMPVLLYDFTDVVAFGAEHSTMGPIVAAAAGKAGVTLSPDPMPEENLFVRSDHYSFVKAGVPSVFLVTGFQNGGEKAFRGFLATHYHKVSDQIDLPFNWEASAKFARINYLIAREIANAPEAPRWYEGDEYGTKFAPDAPKAPKPAKPDMHVAPDAAPTE